MAHAILPQDRGSAVPCAEPADLPALVAELIEAEGLSPLEAQSQALALVGELHAYATVWDADATLAGHPDALPGAPALDPIGALPVPRQPLPVT